MTTDGGDDGDKLIMMMMMIFVVMQTINEWLPAAEKQLVDFSPIAAEQRAVRIQTEQLKVQSTSLIRAGICFRFTNLHIPNSKQNVKSNRTDIVL